MNKKFEIKNGDVSDGFHTFDELYDHRCLLFINLCLQSHRGCYWYEHYKGWPCLTLQNIKDQISYHIPEKYLFLIREAIQEVSKEEGQSKFDGHDSEKVISRLWQEAATLHDSIIINARIDSNAEREG